MQQSSMVKSPVCVCARGICFVCLYAYGVCMHGRVCGMVCVWYIMSVSIYMRVVCVGVRVCVW